VPTEGAGQGFSSGRPRMLRRIGGGGPGLCCSKAEGGRGRKPGAGVCTSSLNGTFLAGDHRHLVACCIRRPSLPFVDQRGGRDPEADGRRHRGMERLISVKARINHAGPFGFEPLGLMRSARLSGVEVEIRRLGSKRMKLERGTRSRSAKILRRLKADESDRGWRDAARRRVRRRCGGLDAGIRLSGGGRFCWRAGGTDFSDGITWSRRRGEKPRREFA